MSTPDNEPRALAVDLLSEIISYIKQSRPTRTDDKATVGFVYSQLRVGQMISATDFGRAWSPIGGSPTQGTGAQQPPAGTDPAAVATAATAAAAVAQNVKRAMQATYNTEQLVNTMLIVTDNGTLETYSGGGRHLSFAYKEILDAMEAPPAPPRSAADQQRIDAATKVLWSADNTPTPLYNTYKRNQTAYAVAKANYVVNSNRLLADPAQADSAPMLLDPYDTAVRQAYDQWKAQGANDVEAALATVESLGVPLEQGAIADARKLMDAWSIPVPNVPGVKEPYSYVLPSDWAAFDVDNIGWTQLTLTQSDYNSHYASNQYQVNSGSWRGSSESSSGDVGASIMGFGFNGSYSEQDSSNQSESSGSSATYGSFHNDAKNLSIDLEYGLCEIVRPWLITDLFQLKNWYLKGEKANCISDGSITGQVLKNDPLLPMIPTHFLVIRNVRIYTQEWNNDGATLSNYFQKSEGSNQQHSSSASGKVEVPVFGPICLDAGASHSESGYGGQYQDEAGNSFSNDYKAHFEAGALTIRGAQIVAWLSEVLPACPPVDDPALAVKKVAA
ncbi:hypothetical protein M0D69_04100 [Caballeronia sp. SEWSISQ10-4 2]|uniref:hypothetical protein n=1 Tax=Caballeronia sp. SEWSISQ10-4 2 TaxID=2937438 RepID=UPI0026548FA9|nr:hypothetical protein [Caballeronia sp. SEWSISQ10-4 2]MDN7177204.1 hypothetical protein [Caballeronia sp. SEWSISQ10-4 2]